MTIEMIAIDKDYFPGKTGKYLVRTISTGPLKMVSYLQARVAIREKKYSIDIQNQIATHISKNIVE